MTAAIAELLRTLMLTPGLSGHEGRVRRRIRAALGPLGEQTRTDRAGNLILTLPGKDPRAPSVMLFTHMDQLGFVVRRIEPDGLLRLERLGGVPERALAAAAVLCCVAEGRDRLGVIGHKSHHATPQEEKYRVLPYAELFVDIGAPDAAEVRAAGIDIGTPVVYEPRAVAIGEHRVAGTAVDDRAGCAVLIEAIRRLAAANAATTVHAVFSVQEEFNLRGAVLAAQALSPDIAIQLDLVLATDTPDLAARGECRLGGGPGMSLYSFHGRGTLNGVIPHPGLVRLFEATAARHAIPLQRSAQTGVLTDNSYVQLVGRGVACIDLGFPIRYSHAPMEMCDLRDLDALAALVTQGILAIDAGFSLNREEYE
ncbi:MAG TPA: M20/M25/M40 family metallo-hydrolase [Acetobacteraceae bacterium]|nr:M20/M25/M40 family metallo-hydrolase [Acetobacteraceae bacterium]